MINVITEKFEGKNLILYGLFSEKPRIIYSESSFKYKELIINSKDQLYNNCFQNSAGFCKFHLILHGSQNITQFFCIKNNGHTYLIAIQKDLYNGNSFNCYMIAEIKKGIPELLNIPFYN